MHVKATRHMGYNSDLATEEITNTELLIATTAPWATNTTAYPDVENELKGFGDAGYFKDYYLVKNVYGTAIAYNASNTPTSYWLASRLYYYVSMPDYGFLDLCVSDSGNYAYHVVYNRSYSDFWSFRVDSKAIRPILTLKPDITIARGTGKESEPYVLN